MWEESFGMYVPRSDAELRVDLYDWDAIGYDDLLGSVQVPIAELDPGARLQKRFEIELAPNAVAGNREKVSVGCASIDRTSTAFSPPAVGGARM